MLRRSRASTHSHAYFGLRYDRLRAAIERGDPAPTSSCRPTTSIVGVWYSFLHDCLMAYYPFDPLLDVAKLIEQMKDAVMKIVRRQDDIVRDLRVHIARTLPIETTEGIVACIHAILQSGQTLVLTQTLVDQLWGKSINAEDPKWQASLFKAIESIGLHHVSMNLALDVESSVPWCVLGIVTNLDDAQLLVDDFKAIENLLPQPEGA